MYYIIFILLVSVSLVLSRGSPVTENYKDQSCTDPRTMKKHAAYTEWADAYSCTRHRCQPGGRNLAIYTVGCKRVEAPESAIECEEVVEDTNMQFPYCCTRLRCLVVVRGEVWTRVLGQPWEILPAAPWSHMYKMKKPPPSDSSFLPKNAEGPVYELAQDPPAEKNLRSKKLDGLDPTQIRPRTLTDRNDAPDIVIALSTGNERDEKSDNDNVNNKKPMRKHNKPKNPVYPPLADHSDAEDDLKRDEILDDVNAKKTWTPELNHAQWTENDGMVETENAAKETLDNVPEFRSEDKLKSNNLQDLVDAIGTRMRDIENVVQKMSEKVRKPENDMEFSGEKRSPKIHGNHLHNQELATEKSQYPDEAGNPNGYFSDASNSMRKTQASKDPPAIYMAPVENRRPSIITEASDLEDFDKKHKKHHKKKKNKLSHHKKHHMRDEKHAKGFNKINSLEMQQASTEDNSLNL